MSHAVVIGGSSGIGASIVERLLARGTRVSSISRRLTPARSGLLPLQADVTSDSLEPALNRAADARGPFDHLIYSAGVPIMGDSLRLTEGEARSSFEVNFWGLDRSVRASLPHLAKGGSVLAILSVAALCPIPFEAYYCAAKAAAAAYCECLEFELRPRGIHMKYLCPGFVDNGFIQRASWVGHPPTVPASGLTSGEVARQALELLDSSSVSAVLGWRERALVLARRYSPGVYRFWQERKSY